MKQSMGLLLCWCLSIGWLSAQRTLTGTVSDREGSPLIGATVSVIGSATGTATDINGAYMLQVEPDARVLQVSYTGFTTLEVNIGASDIINVVLEEHSEILEEVVVTALGFETKRAKIGVASSTVQGSALAQAGEVGLINSLAGKSAGLQIVSSSGDPGAGARIQIRGATSITGDLQPLIIIDGIPVFNDYYYGQGFGGNAAGSGGSTGSGGGVIQQSRLNDLNPEDIEKIEVLRGASAAAIWGSRAANGVLIITTKKGKYKAGKDFTVALSSSIGFDEVNKEIPLQTSFGQGNNGIFEFAPGGGRSWGDKIAERSGGTDNFITDPNAPGYGGYFEAANGTRYYAVPSGNAANPHGGKNARETFDPYDMLFHTGKTLVNNFNISHGGEKGSVYFSMSNTSQEGIVRANSNLNKTTAMLNASKRLGNKLTVEAGANYSFSNSDRVQMGSNLNGLFLGGLRSPADFNADDFVGTFVDAGGNQFVDRQRAYRNPLGGGVNSIYDNPLWMIYNIQSNAKVNRFIGKVEFRYEPTNWLNFTARAGSDTYTDEREDFFPFISSGLNNSGRFTKETITSSQYQMDFIARARFHLSQDIAANALVGVGFNEQNLDDHGATSRGFFNPVAPPQLPNGTGITVFNQESHQRTAGAYSTLGLEFYDQLFVNLSGRFDYLSTLPEQNNGLFYPAADLAWQFTKLLPSNKILSSGRLRLGYGKVGRGPSPYITRNVFFGPTAASVGWGEGWSPGIDPSAYGGANAQTLVAANPDIRPEIKTEVEGGLDLGFWKDRINLKATYYDNKTEDLIIQVSTPQSSGFVSQVTNAASIRNRGIELEWGLNLLRAKDIDWNIYGNFTRNRNEVLEMSGANQVFLSGFNDPGSSAVLGEQLGVLYGSGWERDGAGKLVLDENGFPVQGATLKVLADPNPDFRVGLGTGITYKNFSANVLFDFNIGGEYWNGTRGALAFFGRTAETGIETTLSAEQAEKMKVFTGETVALYYPGRKNNDGTYTVRGQVKDFGAGDVLVEETWYRIGPGSGFTGPSEEYMEDATWSRLRELTLSYSIGKNQLGVNWLERATITVTGRNLILWTQYLGNDPDTNLAGPGNNGYGIDYFLNPGTRTYKVSLNLTF